MIENEKSVKEKEKKNTFFLGRGVNNRRIQVVSTFGKQKDVLGKEAYCVILSV